MTVPAMPAMPQLISANSSPRDMRREIGPDQQRRLDHADEDMHGRADAQRPADAERSPQHPGEARTILQHAPVEQQRGQRGIVSTIGKARKARMKLRRDGSRRRAGRRRRDSRTRSPCRRRSPSAAPRRPPSSSSTAATAGGNLMSSRASAICSATPPIDDAQRNGATVLAQREGDGEQDRQREQTVKDRHAPRRASFRERSEAIQRSERAVNGLAYAATRNDGGTADHGRSRRQRVQHPRPSCARPSGTRTVRISRSANACGRRRGRSRSSARPCRGRA